MDTIRSLITGMALPLSASALAEFRIGPRKDPVLSTATSAAGHFPARANARQVQGEAGEPDQQQARRREHCAGGRARRVQQECDNEYYGCNYGEHPVPFRCYVIGASGGLVYLLGFGTGHVIFGFTPI
jgi:hypothetical protein